MSRILVCRLSLGAGLMLAALAGCADKKAVKEAAEPRVTEAELRSFCPRVEFQDDAAFYNIYMRGNEGNPDKIIYQAVISDLTRACRYPEGELQIQVGIAGRIVPGPVFRTDNIIVPIEIKVMRGDEVLYSKVYKYTVSDSKSGRATQFLFSDNRISLARTDDRNIKVYAGFAVKEK